VSESQDLREFIREQTLRLERIAVAMEKSNRLVRAELREHFAEQRRKTDEIIAEGRAQREALFRVLARLDGGGAASAG
jgi:hypothetical protein